MILAEKWSKIAARKESIFGLLPLIADGSRSRTAAASYLVRQSYSCASTWPRSQGWVSFYILLCKVQCSPVGKLAVGRFVAVAVSVGDM